MEHSEIELEILCNGEQPLNKEGDLIHNIIPLSKNNQQLTLKSIKRKALGFIHYFIHCKIYDISKNDFITGTLWSIKDNKRSPLGRYVNRYNRFAWEPLN
jgi:hypothetical protein